MVLVLVCVCVRSAPSSAVSKLNGQTTPLDVSSLSQNEIQGLLLGSHPSASTATAAGANVASNASNITHQQQSAIVAASAAAANGAPGGGGASTVVITADQQRQQHANPAANTISIKREPEDLRKDPKNGTASNGSAASSGQKVSELTQNFRICRRTLRPVSYSTETMRFMPLRMAKRDKVYTKQ